MPTRKHRRRKINLNTCHVAERYYYLKGRRIIPSFLLSLSDALIIHIMGYLLDYRYTYFALTCKRLYTLCKTEMERNLVLIESEPFLRFGVLADNKLWKYLGNLYFVIQNRVARRFTIYDTDLEIYSLDGTYLGIIDCQYKPLILKHSHHPGGNCFYCGNSTCVFPNKELARKMIEDLKHKSEVNKNNRLFVSMS